MPTSYHHLSSEERAVIMLARQENQSMRSIPRKLDRSVWAIGREIRRTNAARYDARQAAQGYTQRRRRCVRKPVLVAKWTAAPRTTPWPVMSAR